MMNKLLSQIRRTSSICSFKLILHCDDIKGEEKDLEVMLAERGTWVRRWRAAVNVTVLFLGCGRCELTLWASNERFVLRSSFQLLLSCVFQKEVFTSPGLCCSLQRTSIEIFF